MSSMLPAGFEPPNKAVKVTGQDDGAPLTAEELALQRRLFSSIETMPDKFKGWVPEYQALNALPWSRSQVQGLPLLNSQVKDLLDQQQATIDALTAAQIIANFDYIDAEEQRLSSVYGDLATVGPQLNGLVNGTYLLLYGSRISIQTSAPDFPKTSISINGAAAQETDRFDLTHSTDAIGASLSTARLKVLTNANNNSIVMKYKTQTGTDCRWGKRWLMSLKIGP